MLFNLRIGAAWAVLGGVLLSITTISAPPGMSTPQVATPSGRADDINFVNPLMDFDWLNEGRPVGVRNDGLPSFGPNSFTAQSYYEDNHYRVVMQRVPAAIAQAPWVHHSLRFTTVVPGASRPLDQGLLVYQAFEGSTVGALRWGTPAAKPISVGFWARASVGGRYAFAIQNLYPDDGKPPRHVPDRSFVANFTLQPGRWQFIRIENIPGDTVGAWISSGSTPALQMGFTLDYPPRPVTPGVTMGLDRKWVRGNALAAQGQVNLPEHAGASFEFTAIQWNVGSKLADRRPIRDAASELALERRNFQKSYADGVMIGTPGKSGFVQWRPAQAGRYGARIKVSFKAPLRTSSPRMVTYSQFTGRQWAISIDGVDDRPAALLASGNRSATVVTRVRDWRPGNVVEFQWTAEGPWM